MGDLTALVRVLWSTLRAVVVAIVRRLLRGPLVAGWSWGVELRLVALRALLAAGLLPTNRESLPRSAPGFEIRLPRRLRQVVVREAGRLGGRPGEWLRRRGGMLTDRGTVLYLHGGGYVAGGPASHRRFAGRLVWETHCNLYLPDYRLAPEHLFPAALEDAEAVYEDLLRGGVDPARMVLAGDSAGGGLAAALLLRLRDRGRPLPAGAVLFSPYVDLENSGASMVRNAATDYLPAEAPGRTLVEYLGDHDPRDPYASPIYGDFTGIPPLLIFAGGREMILDDAVRLADRASGAAELVVEEDMFHVWPAILPDHPASLRTLARTAEFVASCVGGEGG